MYSAVVQQWARHDPAAAAEWIETQDVPMQGALAFQIANAQAAESPVQRARALSRANAGIAARDPMLATAYLDKLPPGNVRNSVVAEVAMQVAQSRPHSAVDWLRDLPDVGLRMAAVNAVARRLSLRQGMTAVIAAASARPSRHNT